MKTDISSLKTDVSLLKTDVASLKEGQTSLDQKVDKIELGIGDVIAMISITQKEVIKISSQQEKHHEILKLLSFKSIEHEEDITLLKRAK